MINNFNQVLPAAYAHRENLTFEKIISEIELKAKTDSFLSELTKSLKRSGCKLIGHIKGLINADDNGHLMFSITSFTEDAHFKGGMVGGITRAILTINIIVYGIDRKIIETDYQKTFNKHFR
jgi:hypothetical protein